MALRLGVELEAVGITALFFCMEGTGQLGTLWWVMWMNLTAHLAIPSQALETLGFELVAQVFY
jgi:hypothetical protein